MRTLSKPLESEEGCFVQFCFLLELVAAHQRMAFLGQRISQHDWKVSDRHYVQKICKKKEDNIDHQYTRIAVDRAYSYVLYPKQKSDRITESSDSSEETKKGKRKEEKKRI